MLVRSWSRPTDGKHSLVVCMVGQRKHHQLLMGIEIGAGKDQGHESYAHDTTCPRISWRWVGLPACFLLDPQPLTR